MVSLEDKSSVSETHPVMGHFEERFRLPVQRNNHVVEREAGGVPIVHVPNPFFVGVGSIVGVVKHVVDRDDERQQPSEDSQDLVGDDRVLGVRVALGEGVD